MENANQEVISQSNTIPPNAIPPVPPVIHGSSKRLIILIVLVIIAILALGGVGWTYRDAIAFGFNPKGITDQSFGGLFDTKTLHVKAVLDVEVPPSSPISGPEGMPVYPSGPFGFLSVTGGNVSLILEDDLDRTDPGAIKTQAALNLNITSKDNSSAFKGEIRDIGDLLFIKVTDIPLSFPAEAWQYVGPWWKIDLVKAQQVQEKQLEDAKQKIAQLPADQREPAERYFQSKSQIQLTREIAPKVARLISEAKFFGDLEKVGREEIDGVSTYHVKRLVSKKGLEDFLIKWLELASSYSPHPDIESSRTEIKKGLAKLPDIPIHFWIGVKDFRLYQIQPDFSELLKDKPIRKVSLTLTFTKHGLPVAIEAPADAKEFDLSRPFLGGSGLPFFSAPSVAVPRQERVVIPPSESRESR